MGDGGGDNYYDGGWLQNWRDFWSGAALRPHIPSNFTVIEDLEPESLRAN